MKTRMMKAFVAVCAVLLLAAAVMELLPIAHAEQYRVGDAEISGMVKNLEIEWTSGKVCIEYHSGSSVIISEKANGRISEDRRMRWSLDGGTLRILYDKPGFHLFAFFSPRKELTVTLPEDIVLKDTKISTTSADISIPALHTESLKLETTSGDIHAKANTATIKAKLTSGDMELQAMDRAEEISIKSTSGNITLEAAGAMEKITVETTSGSISAAVKQTERFKASSTSGSIHAVIGEAKKAEIHSTSGDVIVEITQTEELDVHTTSGGVTAFLPTAPGFTARIETTSGHIDNKLPLAKEGKDYLCGDGSGTIKIHTTSGNIAINAQK